MKRNGKIPIVELPTKFLIHYEDGMELENYLVSIYDTSGIPLIYIICKLVHNATNPVHNNATRKLIWEAPLCGGNYELDC